MSRPLDPGALRRTGKPVHIRIPPEEAALYAADAAERGVSLAKHIRDMLALWHRQKRAKGAANMAQWLER